MRRLAVVLGYGLVVFSGAARAQFCPGVTPWVFNDVPSNDPFCSYITYIATSGITEPSSGTIVRGDSTDPNHVDEIVVLSYDSGRSNAGTRVDFQDLTSVMNAHRASPPSSSSTSRPPRASPGPS